MYDVYKREMEHFVERLGGDKYVPQELIDIIINIKPEEMSKPKNNRVMCPDCGRAKMLFETERKANDFIKWNGDDIDTHGGELRPYYCPSCCGWHLSSKEHVEEYDHRTENLIGAYKRSLDAKKKRTKLDVAIRNMVGWDSIPDKIWDEMPRDVKDTTEKKVIRAYITEYFVIHGIEEVDGGKARTKVYDMWYDHRYEICHS